MKSEPLVWIGITLATLLALVAAAVLYLTILTPASPASAPAPAPPPAPSKQPAPRPKPRPSPPPEPEVLTVAKASVFRAPEEVWRSRKSEIIDGDTLAPGVRLDAWLCEVSEVKETGTKLRVVMGVSNTTGMDVSCGLITLYLFDAGGYIVWQSESKGLVVKGRDGFAQLGFDEFCPPWEWGRVKSAGLWIAPRRR